MDTGRLPLFQTVLDSASGALGVADGRWGWTPSLLSVCDDAFPELWDAVPKWNRIFLMLLSVLAIVCSL